MGRKIYYNATIRIRRIAAEDLDMIVEMINEASARVNQERFLNLEDQPQSDRIVDWENMSTGQAIFRDGELTLPTGSKVMSSDWPPLNINGDVNFGPAACPRCGRVDDTPCKVVHSKNPDLVGRNRKHPHPERLEANKRVVLQGKFVCLSCNELANQVVDMKALRNHLREHPDHKVVRV